jgi:hypothetical protein
VKGCQELELVVAEEWLDLTAGIAGLDLEPAYEIHHSQTFGSAIEVVTEEPQTPVTAGPAIVTGEVVRAQCCAQRSQMTVDIRYRDSTGWGSRGCAARHDDLRFHGSTVCRRHCRASSPSTRRRLGGQ